MNHKVLRHTGAFCHMPGLGPDAEVTSFQSFHHIVQFGFQVGRWFIPLGKPQRIRCKR